MLPFTSCFVGCGGRKITLCTTLSMTVSTNNCQKSNSTQDRHSESFLFPETPSFVTRCIRREKNRLSTDSLAAIEPNKLRHRLSLCGRFLTLRKRRKKRPSTCDLRNNRALLDDLYNGSTQTMLNQISSWPFNAFSLDRATGGRPLPTVCFHLFHCYGLLGHFQLDPIKVLKFFSLVEEGYRSSNPYHNAIHATDVTQAMHCFLLEEKMRLHLTPLEIVGSLIAAMAHDLDHPGVNQPFLVATSNHLASLYKNASVLENHHWRSAMGCLKESGMMDALDRSSFLELQDHIKSLILATDIARQQEFLITFQEHLKNDSLDMKRRDHRHFMLQIALKCADISNPCRPWEISRAWSIQVTEEFYRQGDLERNMGLPVTPPCDRFKSSISKIQIGFFRFIAAPLFEEWHRFHDTGLSGSMLNHLRLNERKWEAILNYEESGNCHLAKILFDSNNTSHANNLKLGSEESSLPMECLVPQGHLPSSNDEEIHESKDLLDTGFMDQAFSLNRSKDEEFLSAPRVFYPSKSSIDRHASALSQQRENYQLYHPCADYVAGVNDHDKPGRSDSLCEGAFESVAKRRPGILDQDTTNPVLLIKKEKKTKKVLYQHLTGFLSASLKKQLPPANGKKNNCVLNSSSSEGSRLIARRGSAPTTFQPHSLIDISRLKRSCNMMNCNRNNTVRLPKYPDQNGCALRRRGSLPYDIGRRMCVSEWSMGTKFNSETTDSELKRDSMPSNLHSNTSISRCKAPVGERLIGKDADITAGANIQGFTRDCVSNFLLRDCRVRSFRRRRSGGPELFASVVWRSPMAQLTRPPSVHVNAVFSSQELSNQPIGELVAGEDRSLPGRRGSGPIELLAEMWRHRGSRSERSSIDSDDHFLRSHFSEICYNSVSSDGLHYVGAEDFLPEYARMRRSSCPFACSSVVGKEFLC